jgi:hypothetical protein
MSLEVRHRPFPVDVDDTLVIWNTPYHERDVNFRCPYKKEILTCTAHKPNIRILKEKFARGYLVIVWSQGGKAHADAVVKALGLQDFVNITCDKPEGYMDDLPCSEWMGTRLWLKPDMNYKNKSNDEDDL